MRKPITIFVLFTLLPVFCFAGVLQDKQKSVILKKNAAVECTYTQKDSGSGTASGTTVAYSTTIYSKASSFTAASSYTLKRFTVAMKIAGTGGFTSVTGYVCASDGSTPKKPTLCTAADATVAVGSLNTSTYTTITFDIAAGYSITSGNVYYIAVIPNQVGDTSNYGLLQVAITGTNLLAVADSGGSWSVSDDSATGNFTTSSCE